MSVTYIGVIVVVVGKLFEMAGVPFSSEEFGKALSQFLEFVGVLVTLYGRWRLGDLKWFGARK
jgi:hypothetical protein